MTNSATHSDITRTDPTGNYASVNGLSMYYEMHGAGGVPLVLIHGAFSAIGTSFGAMIPSLAEKRQVIGVELQGHGHTADIDRPLSVDNMADDVVVMLRQLGIESADLLGYSLGSAVAMKIALEHSELVRKLVLASSTYSLDGLHPGMAEGMQALQPEQLIGSPFHDEYLRLAPNPEDFSILVAKMKQMYTGIKDWSPEAVQGIKAPTLLVIGDSDIVRPEHSVEMFRLLGGGVIGDLAGLPNSRLAVLPGTTHVTLVAQRAGWLAPMITDFLDSPMPGEGSEESK